MANEKVTGLTELTAPVATDQILVIDDPAGTPASKKMELSKVMPTGGTENQVLAKSGAGYGALKWYTLPQQNDVAFFEQGTAVTFATAGGVIPLAETMNDITDCSVADNVITVPAGTFLLHAMIGGFVRTGISALYLWDETADEHYFTGPYADFNTSTVSSYTWLGGGVLLLQTVLVVASENDFSLRAKVSIARAQIGGTALSGLDAGLGSLTLLKIK